MDSGLINDITRIISQNEYRIKPNRLGLSCVNLPDRGPTIEGLDRTLVGYTYALSFLPVDFSRDLFKKYFEQYPNDYRCYFVFNKEEVNEMIRRLEIIRDNMED